MVVLGFRLILFNNYWRDDWYVAKNDKIHIVLISIDCDINDNNLDIFTREPLKSNIIPLSL